MMIIIITTIIISIIIMTTVITIITVAIMTIIIRSIVNGSITAVNCYHKLVHPVSVRGFPSFRTQPLENLSRYQ